MRAEPYLLAHRGGSKATPIVLLKATLFTLVAAIAYGALLTVDGPPAVFFLAFMVFGIATLALAINVAHDAVHGCLTGRRPLDYWIAVAIFALLGVDGQLWARRHTGSHHVFPNVSGCDADIDQNPFLRLSPHHARRPWHRWQAFYAPLVYAIVALHSIFVQDLHYLRRDRLANIGVAPHRVRTAFVLLACKALYFTVALGLPIAFTGRPIGQIVAAWLLSTAAVSIAFVLLLIGTHFAEEATFPRVSEDGNIDGSWASHAMATSVDWSPLSPIAHFFVGGVNAHAAHHLFPRVSHGHYRALSRLIAETARQTGTVYNEQSFVRLMRSHFRLLRRLGEVPLYA